MLGGPGPLAQGGAFGGQLEVLLPAVGMLGGIGLLSQLGFTIAVGIAIVSFGMAALLIPSIAALLGHLIWWPGHSATSTEAESSPTAEPRSLPALKPQPVPDE